MVLLADLGLEFGMTVRSRKLVEEVMPQVRDPYTSGCSPMIYSTTQLGNKQIINGDDLELRAFACFVLARCIIACAKRSRK